MSHTVPAPARLEDVSAGVRLGDLLIERALISATQLQDAVLAQQQAGGYLGRHLLLSGALTRRQLTSTLADLWGIGQVDLVANPPRVELVRAAGADHVLEHGWLVHSDDGTTLDVATVREPTSALVAQVAAQHPGRQIRFFATSDFDLDSAALAACRDELAQGAGDGFALMRPDLSARSGVVRWQMVGFWSFVAALVLGFGLFPLNTLTLALLLVNLGFLIGVSFKTVMFAAGVACRRRQDLDDLEVATVRAEAGAGPEEPRISDDDLPMYTILVPAFREANIVAKLLSNLDALDYPKAKLQVLLLLEEDDVDTIAAAKASAPPEYVRILIVPRGVPQTKPRACNLGLTFATGKYLVIFDAEDRPEPQQLRMAVAAFRRADAQEQAGAPPTVCVQARLNYFNAQQNLLTRLFTLEYSMWFDYMLPGLDAARLPIPLGGTSNHFDVAGLRRLGGWDAWNVTEDADLGVRASALGSRVSLIASTTWEEACSATFPWIRQRTRWVKGYMLTALVYARHPWRLWKATGWRGLVGMGGLVAGTPLSFLAAPLLVALTVFTYAGGQIAGVQLAPWVSSMTTANMLLGNGAMIAVHALAAVHRGERRLVGFALLSPVYWMLHGVAAWRALWQVLRNPFVWEKTPHGLNEAVAVSADVG